MFNVHDSVLRNVIELHFIPYRKLKIKDDIVNYEGLAEFTNYSAL